MPSLFRPDFLNLFILLLLGGKQTVHWNLFSLWFSLNRNVNLNTFLQRLLEKKTREEHLMCKNQDTVWNCLSSLSSLRFTLVNNGISKWMKHRRPLKSNVARRSAQQDSRLLSTSTPEQVFYAAILFWLFFSLCRSSQLADFISIYLGMYHSSQPHFEMSLSCVQIYS